MPTGRQVACASVAGPECRIGCRGRVGSPGGPPGVETGEDTQLEPIR